MSNNTVSELEIVNITVGDGYVVPALANGNEAVQTNEELQKILNNLTQQVRVEAEIALARKVFAVSRENSPMRPKGMTMKKRLKLITDKMLEIIPKNNFITEEALRKEGI